MKIEDIIIYTGNIIETDITWGSLYREITEGKNIKF